MVKRLTYKILTSAVTLILIGTSSISYLKPIAAENGNVLVNPGFEDGSFREYYPNHWVAADWNRWWIHGTTAPEYTDAAWARFPYEGNHAQIYHSWGDYTAGIFQVVDGLTACRPYQLTMYTKTNAGSGTLPHSRIGLDPTGTMLTNDGAVKNGLPPNTVWSEEQTRLSIWEELSVKTEPTGNELTAILYAAPRPNSFYETYWDSGSLIPASYDTGRLPEPTTPSSFIYDISVITGTERITITWHTTEPASASQIWYNVSTPSTPVTPTTTMTHSAYLPLIKSGGEPYPYATGISFMRATEHHALINSLNPGQIVKFIVVARRLNGDSCETAQSEVWQVRTGNNP